MRAPLQFEDFFMRLLVAVLSLAFVAVAPAALASEPAPTSEAAIGVASTTAAAPKEKKVCRREMASGSILTRYVCRTKAEWAEIDEINRRNTDIVNAARNGRGGLSPTQ
jgi:hypothetical protein